jgi:short subunit dehydrogenase-like uncharacterized protein
MKENFLIYGAYGYTGQLIAKLAVQKGLKPILAGRNALKTRNLAENLGLEYLAFDLSDKNALFAALGQVKAILHCAGPFVLTSPQVLEACLQTQTHYLDITGEIEIFELLAKNHTEAQKAGITLLPGVGFDVVPSDCLALFLKKSLPDATHLELAFMGLGGVSRGTALTMALNIDKGGAIRKDGKIIPVATAFEVKEIDYGFRKAMSVAIPWGDVSTAFYSTQIPNIKVFMAQPPKMIAMLKNSKYLNWLLRMDWVKNIIKKMIESRITGPNQEQRETSKSYLWGQVCNANGVCKQARLVCPEGYTLTAITAVLAVEKVLSTSVPTGFLTPSMAFGEDFILEVESVKREMISN